MIASENELIEKKRTNKQTKIKQIIKRFNFKARRCTVKEDFTTHNYTVYLNSNKATMAIIVSVIIIS